MDNKNDLHLSRTLQAVRDENSPMNNERLHGTVPRDSRVAFYGPLFLTWGALSPGKRNPSTQFVSSLYKYGVCKYLFSKAMGPYP